MWAVEVDRYGGVEVLAWREVSEPRLRPGTVRVAVEAAGLNPKDVIIRSGRFRLLTGWRFPRRVGYDWAGRVLELGPGVNDLAVGERVFGMINDWGGGAAATVVVAERAELARAPSAWTAVEAAATPLAALTALQALRDEGGLSPGQRVVIHGASGGVGTFAIPIARELGGTVISTSSAANMALCAQLGAHQTVDYRDGAAMAALAGVDCWFDVFGNHRFADIRPRLSPRGRMVSTVPKAHIFAAQARTVFSAQRCRLVVVRSNRVDLEQIAAWAERMRPVIDSTFPIAEVAAAQTRVGSRRARGKVVLRVEG